MVTGLIAIFMRIIRNIGQVLERVMYAYQSLVFKGLGFNVFFCLCFMFVNCALYLYHRAMQKSQQYTFGKVGLFSIKCSDNVILAVTLNLILLL